MAVAVERVELDPDACWALLRTTGVGRVAYTERAMPAIRAVPYVVDGSSVVIAMPAAHPELFDQPTVVAFEAGEWAPDRREGWSVCFVGKAHRLACHELSPWIDGEPTSYARVSVEILSGHRVGAPST